MLYFKEQSIFRDTIRLQPGAWAENNEEAEQAAHTLPRQSKSLEIHKITHLFIKYQEKRVLKEIGQN